MWLKCWNAVARSSFLYWAEDKSEDAKNCCFKYQQISIMQSKTFMTCHQEPTACDAELFVHDFLSLSESEHHYLSQDFEEKKVTDILAKETAIQPAFPSEHNWWESTVGQDNLMQGTTVKSCTPVPGCDDQNHSDGDLKSISDFENQYESSCLEGQSSLNISSDIRKQRRREFHKIHTRRSRAKLNERMELLRKVLPSPPPGLIVKSKAQIIDYAISVLNSLLTQAKHWYCFAGQAIWLPKISRSTNSFLLKIISLIYRAFASVFNTCIKPLYLILYSKKLYST